VNFYGRANRTLVEKALEKKTLKDSQIAECDLSGLPVVDVYWDRADVRNLHANDIKFQNARIGKSTFYRSSFLRASFTATVLDTMVLDGLTLIKSQWRDSRLVNTTMKNLCLQRASLSGSAFISSSFVDFEALDARVDNCVFAHSVIGIQYGSGMNGFSSAGISNCVFYHCRFEGYPLRGAALSSCVFVYCSGEIGDDMECLNVAGIGLKGNARRQPLQRLDEARRLVEQYEAGGQP